MILFWSVWIEEHIAEVFFEINMLEANYPLDVLQSLINKLMTLIKYCEKILLDNKEKSSSITEGNCYLGD